MSDVLTKEERERVEEIRALIRADDDAHEAYDADVDGCWGNDEHPKSIAYRNTALAVNDASYYKQRDLIQLVDRLAAELAAAKANERARAYALVERELRESGARVVRLDGPPNDDRDFVELYTRDVTMTSAEDKESLTRNEWSEADTLADAVAALKGGSNV